MKKYIALAIACATLIAGVSSLPAAVEANVPAAVPISPTEVCYRESVCGSGALCYIGQGDVTSALPLVLSEFAVEEGDHVEVGDSLAVLLDVCAKVLCSVLWFLVRDLEEREYYEGKITLKSASGLLKLHQILGYFLTIKFFHRCLSRSDDLLFYCHNYTVLFLLIMGNI